MQNTAVFCDMDGTLLNSEHRISSRTHRAIAGLAGRGIPFAVVTSRGIAGTYPVLELGGVSCTAVTYGGGVILDEGRNVIFHDGFSRAKAQEVADFLGAECPNVAWIAYSFEDWVSPHRSDPRVRREERVVMAEARDGGVDSIERDEVQKLLCICDPEDTLEVERRLSERFPELTVVKSSDILIEVMPAGLSKAGAVRFLCDHWGVDPADALAFGDNYNDVPMLEVAGHSYLMGNAPDELLARMPLHAPGNDEDGVARVLEELGFVR